MQLARAIKVERFDGRERGIRAEALMGDRKNELATQAAEPPLVVRCDQAH
jgi:hypothetical protein